MALYALMSSTILIYMKFVRRLSVGNHCFQIFQSHFMDASRDWKSSEIKEFKVRMMVYRLTHKLGLLPPAEKWQELVEKPMVM